jgi:hypothetical protein
MLCILSWLKFTTCVPLCPWKTTGIVYPQTCLFKTSNPYNCHDVGYKGRLQALMRPLHIKISKTNCVVGWGLLKFKCVLKILPIQMFRHQRGFSWSLGRCNLFDTPMWHKTRQTAPPPPHHHHKKPILKYSQNCQNILLLQIKLCSGWAVKNWCHERWLRGATFMAPLSCSQPIGTLLHWGNESK